MAKRLILVSHRPVDKGPIRQQSGPCGSNSPGAGQGPIGWAIARTTRPKPASGATGGANQRRQIGCPGRWRLAAGHSRPSLTSTAREGRGRGGPSAVPAAVVGLLAAVFPAAGPRGTVPFLLRRLRKDRDGPLAYHDLGPGGTLLRQPPAGALISLIRFFHSLTAFWRVAAVASGR